MAGKSSVANDGITITGQEAVDALMRSLQPANFVKVVVRASVKIAETIKAVLAPYPGPPSHPLKWASAKSRRFYFAMRREAGLPAKYTRTSDPMSQKLGQSWVVVETPDGAILGNPSEYADLVQSDENQTAMHAATGWKTDAMAVQEIENAGIMAQVIAAEIGSFMRGLGGT